MHWCCLLAQNAPLQALLLLNAAPSASFPTSSSTGSTRLGSFFDPEQKRCFLSRGMDHGRMEGHRLMDTGAESALQVDRCSRSTM